MNPLQSLTNRAADAIYWKDSRAGHVPYGRGFMYLAAVDAEIRAHTHNKRSLDDIVLKLLERTRAAEASGGKEQGPTVADWQQLIGKELGSRGVRGYENMVAVGRPLDPGFDISSLSGPKRVIKGLVAGSPAALAGLLDGDEVIAAPDLGDPTLKDADKPLVMNVRRAGQEFSISFVPAGKPVMGYQWKRNKSVSDSDCKA